MLNIRYRVDYMCIQRKNNCIQKNDSRSEIIVVQPTISMGIFYEIIAIKVIYFIYSYNNANISCAYK